VEIIGTNFTDIVESGGFTAFIANRAKKR